MSHDELDEERLRRACDLKILTMVPAEGFRGGYRFFKCNKYDIVEAEKLWTRFTEHKKEIKAMLSRRVPMIEIAQSPSVSGMGGVGLPHKLRRSLFKEIEKISSDCLDWGRIYEELAAKKAAANPSAYLAPELRPARG